MSTNNDGWIETKTRKPTEADLPVWVWRYDDSPTPVCFRNLGFINHEDTTHWKPAAADIPAPPREKTQGQIDTDACDAWYNREWPKVVARYTGGMYPPPPFNTGEVWRAALAYERAEVGKMLPGGSYGLGEAQSALAAIRARCGGGK